MLELGEESVKIRLNQLVIRCVAAVIADRVRETLFKLTDCIASADEQSTSYDAEKMRQSIDRS